MEVNLNFAEPGERGLYAQLGMIGHDGIDLYARTWDPVYASHDGIVTATSTDVNRGLGVEITTPYPVEFIRSPFNKAGEYHAKTNYWHFAANNVVVGQEVRIGQLIGWADNTGNSSGDHLHFALYPMVKNPDGSYAPAFPNNGTYGAVSPIEYMVQDMTAFERNSLIQKIKYTLQAWVNRSKILTG